MILLKDRYIATLLGLHIGDAIWAPYETMSARAVAQALKGRRGVVGFHRYKNPWPDDDNGTFLPAGRPTDDSDQTADLCYSLLHCDGIDPAHLRRALQNSVTHGVSRLWRGRATGAGGTTRRMLSDDETQQAEARANPIASNGSLMRSAPMALWLGPTPSGYPTPKGGDYQAVKAMSEVTHVHPDSVAACWLYVRMLRNALAGRDISDVKPVNKFDRRIRRFWEETEAGGPLPPDPGSFKNGWGSAEYSLKVALWALWNGEDSFTRTIEIVGLAGGDTDTYGAIAGALAGAVYGTKTIPKRWRNTILGADIMRQYAEGIYAVRLQTTD